MLKLKPKRVKKRKKEKKLGNIVKYRKIDAHHAHRAPYRKHYCIKNSRICS